MALLVNNITRLVERYERDGPRAAAILLGKNLPRPLHEWLIRRRMREHQKFDAKYHVDTQMPVPLSDLETSAPGGRFAKRYQGTPIVVLHKIIRRLKVDRSRFTFIDLGSGKGRVLLIAATYPFKTVIGVEFSKKLHDIAKSNIQNFSEFGIAKTSPISINCDAGEFDFSQIEDKIVFCYNPFAADLMNCVLDKLQARSDQGGETIFVYLGAVPSAVLERLSRFPIIDKGEFLTEFDTFEQYSIYKMH
jgi:SAM-dependent methyltransferase